jgi:uncharacterized protein (DUF1501 family)
MPRTSRRSFLEIAGLIGGGVMMRRSILGEAQAQTADPKFLLLVYFSGGWDQLLALDPRDATQTQYKYVLGKAPTTGIYPAYTEMAAGDPAVANVMTATGGTGKQIAGALSFGPAVPSVLTAHSNDLCIVRGMSMDTLTHEVGRRYLLTGKFPRGLAANGSSLNTVVAGQTMSALDLPNLAINVESYNEGYGAFASPTRVNSATDVRTVLNPQSVSPQLQAASETALIAFEKNSDTCEAHGYDLGGLVGAFRASRDQARKMTNSAASTLFQFSNPAPNADISALYSAFNINSQTDLSTSKAKAALAGQAITNGISQVVAVTLADDLDDHFDESGSQSQSLAAGFDALGRLISFLKSKMVPGTTKTFWECTSLMTFSEFSRTPMLNARDGRDHHLTGSCLLASPGLKGNTVFGASSEVGMQAQKFNFTTGAVDLANGSSVRPSDVHATLLKSMGLDYAHLSNTTPQTISKLLKVP